MTTVLAGTLMLTLAACGNSKSASSSSSSSSSTTTKAVKEVKHHSKKSSSSAKNNKTKASSNGDSTTTTSKVAGSNYSVTSSKSKGVVNNESSTSQMTMTAQDAKNIVKEHIGNQLNNAGIAGQPKPNVPTASEVDGYTAVQNGTNNWTVSGNGHTYHVTTTSVTGN